VQPGDNLWTIAQHVQAQTLERTPTQQETASYWTTLLTANHTTLTDPTTPDLLHTGQTLTLPTPHDDNPREAFNPTTV
jgi:nucleoid-associated protein YgaU